MPYSQQRSKTMTDKCTSPEGHNYTAKVIAEAPGLAEFMEEIAAMFKNSGAVNYLEMQFGLKDDELGELVITIQRKDGKTPHELRLESEAAHASPTEKVEKLQRCVDYVWLDINENDSSALSVAAVNYIERMASNDALLESECNQAKREVTLEEWVNGLPEGHRARVELAALKRENDATNAALEINDSLISGVEDALEKAEIENAALKGENEHLSDLAYGPRHDSDCPALWGAGFCRCGLRDRIEEWKEKRAGIDALLTQEQE